MAITVPLNPNECTSPEAWAELVRSERQSALNMMDELALARQAVADLVDKNNRLMAALAARPQAKDEAQ